jgi:hypothetical protein
MRRTIISAVFAGLLAGACTGYVATSPGSVSVTASTPDLVAVGPGVQVIADYDEPIFYADGFYWWSVDGSWYRSTYYTGGWAFVSSPPIVITRIGQPHVYRHYRPHGYVVRHRPVPSHRVQRPPARDHRATRDRR